MKDTRNILIHAWKSLNVRRYDWPVQIAQCEVAVIGMACKPRIWWPMGVWGSPNQLWASWKRIALRGTISERLSGNFRWSQQRFRHQKLGLRETSLISGISTCSWEISRNKYLLRTYGSTHERKNQYVDESPQDEQYGQIKPILMK